MGRSVHPDHKTEDATVAKVDIWLADLVMEFKLFRAKSETESAEKDNRIKELEKKVEALEKKNSELLKTNGTSEKAWSDLFKTGKKKESDLINIAAFNREQKEMKRKENNIVISGVAESSDLDEAARKKHDDEKVDIILDKLGLARDNVKNQTRLKKRINNRQSVSSSSSANNESSNVPLIVLEFKEIEHQQLALKNSRELKNDENFKKVFINADKTPAERYEEKKLRETRNKENAKLPLEVAGKPGRRYLEKNGKKWYWGIRWGKLVLVECQE